MKSMYKAGLTVGAVIIAASLFTIEPLSGQQGGGAAQAPGAGRGQGRGQGQDQAEAREPAVDRRCHRISPRRQLR